MRGGVTNVVPLLRYNRELNMHILLCGPSNKSTSRTIEAGACVCLSERRRSMTICYGCALEVLFGQVPTAVPSVCGEMVHACTSDTVGGERSRNSSRTEDKR